MQDDCILDSNILLRMANSDDPHYAVIGAALKTLKAQQARLCFTSQTLGEFWNASTRPLRWRQLLITHDIKGVQVHDARLAASMYVHAVPRLLTINVRDFKRFAGLTILHPADLSTSRY